MAEKLLSTPINAAALTELRIGDIVYLNGLLVTGRDRVHQRIVRHKRPLPVDMNGLVIFHAGPIVRQLPESAAGTRDPHHCWELISIGPTTSMRMESYQEEFLEAAGVRFIIGKGGMGPKTAKACRRLGAIHAVFPGGCAALAAAQTEAVEAVHWLDLGMGEAMWVLRAQNFGPLIVSIDTTGNNLFENNKRLFEERKKTAVESLIPHIQFMD